MSKKFKQLLNLKLSDVIQEDNNDIKAPHGKSYDRQYSEDLLYHTIGPLTDSPKWVNQEWNSPNPQPENYKPGGPADHWTEEEVIFAIAGNPSKLHEGGTDSPHHGRMGGSPMVRAVKKAAAETGSKNILKDKDAFADMYANGMVVLARMMKPGFDEGRSAFIPYVMKSLIGGIKAGPGASLKSTNSEEIRDAAETVAPEYRSQRSYDKAEGNPFGQYSSDYYKTMTSYADALENGDESQIEAAQNRMRQLVDTIQDANPNILGIAGGQFNTISNKDRKTAVSVASMDAGKDDEAGNLGSTLAGDNEESPFDPESINYILKIAIENDLGQVLNSSEKYKQMAIDLKAKGGKIGGPMNVNELRYIIRQLGTVGSNYPGAGTMRSNTNVPRDTKGWWQPGEDPEIEPLPNGEGQWNSIWKRGGYQPMQATATANEMTMEVEEFNELGIETARIVKEKKNGKKEALSKIAVQNTFKSAKIKLMIIANIHRSELGLDESVNEEMGLMEDTIDREIIASTCDQIVEMIEENEAKTLKSQKSKGSSLFNKAMKRFTKPQRPGQRFKNEEGITSALKYQNKVADWTKKHATTENINEDSSDDIWNKYNALTGPEVEAIARDQEVPAEDVWELVLKPLIKSNQREEAHRIIGTVIQSPSKGFKIERTYIGDEGGTYQETEISYEENIKDVIYEITGGLHTEDEIHYDEGITFFEIHTNNGKYKFEISPITEGLEDAGYTREQLAHEVKQAIKMEGSYGEIVQNFEPKINLLAKQAGLTPTYVLACAIDDIEAGIGESNITEGYDSGPRTISELMVQAATALNNDDEDTLLDLQEQVRSWMQTDDEQKAQMMMLQSMLEAIK